MLYFYSVILNSNQKNELLRETIWMKCRDTILSKRSQIQRNIYCIMAFICMSGIGNNIVPLRIVVMERGAACWFRRARGNQRRWKGSKFWFGLCGHIHIKMCQTMSDVCTWWMLYLNKIYCSKNRATYKEK